MRWLVLLLAVPLWSQQPSLGGIPIGSATVTPALVNFSGMPSTETTALGAKVSNTCATDAYCAPMADPTLAGNGVIIFYKYKPASANTADIPTITTYLANGTATGDSYTHCGTDANDSTNHFYLGCFYRLTATTGTASVRATFADADTNVAVGTAQFYNATAVDVYSSNTGTATTTFTAGSATSTANGDIWFNIGCGTTTLTNVGAFTLGSQAGIAWVGDMFDRRDACGIQHGIQTSAGALNAQFTAASNAFVDLAVSFKAGSQGTAPSGMYVKRIYHVNSASGSSNLAYQINADAGDLQVVTTSGGAQSITAVSDTTNSTWTPCNVAVFYSNGPVSSGAYYFPNSAAGQLAVTETVSGTGDTGPSMFYDVAGAATTQYCGVSNALQNITTAASSFTATTTYVPSASSGITIAAQSLFGNTALGTTNGTQDCSTVGGQVISGPSLPDQNNGCSHWTFSNNIGQNVVYNLSDTATTTVGTTSADIVSFQAVGATAYPAVIKTAQNHATTSGTTVAISSFVPLHAGDTIVAFADANSISTGTVSVADPTNGTYTAPNAVSNAAGYRSNIFYIKNIAATTITITATFGTSNSQRSLMIVEVSNVSTTAPLDQAAAVTAETAGTGGKVTGPSLTTLSANEVIVAAHICAGNCDQINASFPGQPVAPWSQAIGDTEGNILTFLAAGATNSFASQAIDSAGSGASDAVGMLTLKQ